jgi:membrane-bound lytic murein transglycosylase B
MGCRHYAQGLLLAGVLASHGAHALELDEFPRLQALATTLNEDHGFDVDALRELFAQVEINPRVIELMTTPGEARPWFQYRDLFVTVPHANRGARFWRKYRESLTEAERVFQVDPAVVISIIGIETQYGRAAGSLRAVDTLATLTVDYPRRSEFFGGQLLQLLLLAHEQQLDPLSIKGSYAGAIGMPQFLPGTYRAYAVDFDGDRRADLMNSMDDAIGSVANYFRAHDWRAGEPACAEARVEGKVYPWLSGLDTAPALTLAQLENFGIRPVGGGLAPGLRANLLAYDGEDGPVYRLAFDNFYVIRRYNMSNKYALAVCELADMIRERYRPETE